MASLFGICDIPGTEGITWHDMWNGTKAVVTGHDDDKEDEVMANLDKAAEYSSMLNTIANKNAVNARDAVRDAVGELLRVPGFLQYVGEINGGRNVFDEYFNYISTIIKEFATAFDSAVDTVKRYSEASFGAKAWDTFKMVTTKFGEGFTSVFEDIGDGFWTLASFVPGVDMSENIEWEWSKELWDGIRGDAEYSAFTEDSLGAGFFKLSGSVTGYIFLGAAANGAGAMIGGELQGGGRVAQLVGKATFGNAAKTASILKDTTLVNAGIAGIAGVGNGTSASLREGNDFDTAKMEGLATGVFNAALAYGVGRGMEKYKITQAEKALDKADDALVKATENTDDAIRSAQQTASEASEKLAEAQAKLSAAEASGTGIEEAKAAVEAAEKVSLEANQSLDDLVKATKESANNLVDVKTAAEKNWGVEVADKSAAKQKAVEAFEESQATLVEKQQQAVKAADQLANAYKSGSEAAIEEADRILTNANADLAKAEQATKLAQQAVDKADEAYSAAYKAYNARVSELESAQKAAKSINDFDAARNAHTQAQKNLYNAVTAPKGYDSELSRDIENASETVLKKPAISIKENGLKQTAKDLVGDAWQATKYAGKTVIGKNTIFSDPATTIRAGTLAAEDALQGGYGVKALDRLSNPVGKDDVLIKAAPTGDNKLGTARTPIVIPEKEQTTTSNNLPTQNNDQPQNNNNNGNNGNGYTGNGYTGNGYTGNGTPFAQNQNNNSIPSTNDKPADTTPEKTEVPEKTPNVPSDGGNKPSDGGNKPSDGGNKPSDGGNKPSDGGNKPSDGGTGYNPGNNDVYNPANNDNTGSYHTGGGYTGTGGFSSSTGGNNTTTPTTKKATTSIDDIIKGNKYTKVPTSTTPITPKTQSGSGLGTVIPIAAGLSAAAAAGIGAKAYLDRKKNNDNGEYDDEDDDFGAEEWNGDENTIEVDYDDSSDTKTEQYLDDDDEEFGSQEVPEIKYDARNNEELADLQ